MPTDDWSDDTPIVEKAYDGEVVERIDLRELKPLFDTDHAHHYVPDPDDRTDEYQAEMCDVKDCGMGRLIPLTRD